MNAYLYKESFNLTCKNEVHFKNNTSTAILENEDLVTRKGRSVDMQISEQALKQPKQTRNRELPPFIAVKDPQTQKSWGILT